MSGASDAVARVGRVAFELERFAMTGDDRCVVEGSWFGVRGRRFMRPSLTVVVEGAETRFLADLADKPWAAEDGEPWRASFPVALDVSDMGEAELTVAPDLTIALQGSPEPGRRGKPRPSGARARSTTSRARRDAAPRPKQRQPDRRLERVEAEKAQLAARLDELLDQLSQVAHERDEASAKRDRLMAEQDQRTAELDALQQERDEIAAELEAARSARGEAVKASDAARGGRARALEDGAAAIAARRRAESERDAAIAARDRAIAERDGALSLRDHAVTERDAAEAARDDTIHQRDALVQTSERLQSEFAELSSSHGAALVMRRAAQEGAAFRRSPAMGPAAIAILVLLAVIVVLIVTRAV